MSSVLDAWRLRNGNLTELNALAQRSLTGPLQELGQAWLTHNPPDWSDPLTPEWLIERGFFSTEDGDGEHCYLLFDDEHQLGIVLYPSEDLQPPWSGALYAGTFPHGDSNPWQHDLWCKLQVCRLIQAYFC